MSVKAQTIIEVIERLAPKYLAMDWDNVGLQLGDHAQQVHRVLVSLDLTEQVVKEAEQLGAQMIITHHPLFWEGVKNLRYDTVMGRIIRQLVKNDMVVYSAHTNLDIASGGINDHLSTLLQLHNVQPLQKTNEEQLFKIAVFVPEEYVESVREGMAAAGAGWIGNYSHCTFQAPGVGTFKPLSGTTPFIGEQGRLEYVNEYRLETIVPGRILNRVIKAMTKSHPYEEIAYDIYPLTNNGVEQGLGRIGYLAESKRLGDWVEEIKSALGLTTLQICGDLDAEIKKVAVCGGSGMGAIKHALFKGADLFITGDIKYHDAQDALAQGICLVDAGHFVTENLFIPVLVDYLQSTLEQEKRDVNIIASQQLHNPFCYV